MLVVQQHLKNGVETLESLYDRFGIHHKIKDDMVILDYDQIESHKHKDRNVVKECRGLVLQMHTWNIIAKSFDRFFNIFENSDTDNFDWSDFHTTRKMDGSIIRISMYKDEMQVFTRFSFADQPISELYPKTWNRLVKQCLSERQEELIKACPNTTFVFELCSPYTQVVEYYPEPKLYLLGLFNNQTGEEIKRNHPLYISCTNLFEMVPIFPFTSIDYIQSYLDDLWNKKSPMEGFVVHDKNGIRLKIKNKYYLTLHRLSNNGNITNMKTLLPLVLMGEVDEVLVYFPGLKDSVDILQIAIEDDLKDLANIYHQVINIEDQKEFAIKLTKELYTPYSGIFFSLRKAFGSGFTFEQVKAEFLGSTDLVLKIYKNRGVLSYEE